MGEAKILIVEDEMVVARDVQCILESRGYTVPAIALSGEEALARVTEDVPDLVLMDIELDGDLDGVEVAKRIRARCDVPVVYLTAYADDRTLERTKVTVPFGYVVKPFAEGELYSTVEMAIYRHRMERKLRESEARYRAVVEDQTELICRFRPDGTLTFVNDAYCRYCNRSGGCSW